MKIFGNGVGHVPGSFGIERAIEDIKDVIDVEATPTEEIYLERTPTGASLFWMNGVYYLDNDEIAQLRAAFPQFQFPILEPGDRRLADSMAHQHSATLAKKVVESARKRLYVKEDKEGDQFIKDNSAFETAAIVRKADKRGYKGVTTERVNQLLKRGERVGTQKSPLGI